MDKWPYPEAYKAPPSNLPTVRAEFQVEEMEEIHRGPHQDKKGQLLRSSEDDHPRGRKKQFFFKNVRNYKSSDKPPVFNVRSLCPGKCDADVAELLAEYFNRISAEFLIWSEWCLTVIAATVRIALVDILDLSEVDIPAGVFFHPAVGWG